MNSISGICKHNSANKEYANEWHKKKQSRRNGMSMSNVTPNCNYTKYEYCIRIMLFDPLKHIMPMTGYDDVFAHTQFSQRSYRFAFI